MKEKCKNCARPSKACISYLMTLSTKETIEWCRMWKDRLGWTNAFLAEKTVVVPKGTIDRALNPNTEGVKLVTIRPIICALTGCTVEELEACDDFSSVAALEEKNKALVEELERVKKDVANQSSFLASQIRMKDRYIAVLAILLGVAATSIFAALVIDLFNPHLGFIWR